MPTRILRIATEFLVLALLAVLLGWALSGALDRAAQSEWPFFHDAWRDLGVAQGILDGRYPEDPVILGATLWYNPIAGVLTALAAALTGGTAAEANVAIGPWANLLIPIGCFLFLRLALGLGPAAAGTLFLVAGNALAERVGLYVSTVTYTPWLWSPHIAHGFFFCSLALFVFERKRPSLALRLLFGICWGFTFMTHTAPAVLIGLIYLATTAWEWTRPRIAAGFDPKREAIAALTPIVVAFLASLPYTYSIIWNYQFQVRNELPSRYVDYNVSLGQLPHHLYEALHWSTPVALLGVFWLWRVRGVGIGPRVVLSWTVITVAFLLFTYGNQLFHAATGYKIPQFVPGHHFLMNLGALKAVLVGAGFAAVARGAAAISPPRLAPATRGMAYAACIGLAAFALLPAYAQARSFEEAWDFGWHAEDFEDRARCVPWIVEHCPPDSVFVGHEQYTVRLVMPAARKAVQTVDLFSNPYVPYRQRQRDNRGMHDALLGGDYPRFVELAAPYRVTHLIALDEALMNGDTADKFTTEQIDALALPWIEQVYHADGIALYAIDLEAAA